MPKRYDAVFFDVGYTLVYFEPTVPEITLRALREVGLSVTPEALEAAWAKERDANRTAAAFEATEASDQARERGLRRRLLAALGADDEELLSRFMAHEDAFYAQPGVLRLYPEAPEVLARLRAEGYRLGIISNWSWNLRQRCEQAGLTSYFDVIVGSAYAGSNKPHPAIFRAALDALQVPAPRAIHIGDDYQADVVGARGVGMDAVLVYRGAGDPACDCRFVRDLRELFPLLNAV